MPRALRLGSAARWVSESSAQELGSVGLSAASSLGTERERRAARQGTDQKLTPRNGW